MAHSHDHSRITGDTSGKRLGWTIVFNLVITAAEFVGGLITGYLALIADAVHNLSDVASLILAAIGMKGSRLPATKRSTFGYKRIEVMTAFISAAALVAIAIFILSEAWDRYLNPEPITKPWIFLTVAVIGLVGNVISMLLLHKGSTESLNMKTAYLHMLYDAVSSVGVIIGGIVILMTGWVVIDVILSALIAVMILWSSYLVIKEAALVFLEAVPKSINFDAVLDRIESVRRVRDVHDLHIWSLSSNEVAMSCHICIDDADLSAAPEIVEEIRSTVESEFHIGHCTIQAERKTKCSSRKVLCRYEC